MLFSLPSWEQSDVSARLNMASQVYGQCMICVYRISGNQSAKIVTIVKHFSVDVASERC